MTTKLRYEILSGEKGILISGLIRPWTPGDMEAEPGVGVGVGVGGGCLRRPKMPGRSIQYRGGVCRGKYSTVLLDGIVGLTMSRAPEGYRSK